MADRNAIVPRSLIVDDWARSIERIFAEGIRQCAKIVVSTFPCSNPGGFAEPSKPQSHTIRLCNFVRNVTNLRCTLRRLQNLFSQILKSVYTDSGVTFSFYSPADYRARAKGKRTLHAEMKSDQAERGFGCDVDFILSYSFSILPLPSRLIPAK